MARYFVEYSSLSNSFIVHRERCITYPDADLAAIPRMKRLGEYGDDFLAMAAARQHYPEPCPCYCCFISNYRRSVIANCQPTLSRPVAPG